MKEQDLIDLGFKQNIILPEESGNDYAFRYYTYDFGVNDVGYASLTLISNCNDEAEKNGWIVEVFEGDRIRFTDKDDLEKLILILKNNTNEI